MSEASSDTPGKSTAPEVAASVAQPPKTRRSSLVGQTVAVLIVLAGGAAAAKYVMSIPIDA